MAQKEKKDKKQLRDKASATTETRESYLQTETIQTIVAVLFFVLGVFFLLSAFDKGGKVGELAYYVFHDTLFGVGYYLLPILFFILCAAFFRTLHQRLALTHSIGGILFFISSLGLIEIALPGQGGMVGGFISGPLVNLFAVPASVIILIALILISILVMFDVPL